MLQNIYHKYFDIIKGKGFELIYDIQFPHLWGVKFLCLPRAYQVKVCAITTAS